MHSDYERFLLEQTHLKKSSLEQKRHKLSLFPEPDKLTAEFFRKRMKRLSPVTTKKELFLAKQVFKFLGRDTSDLNRVKVSVPKEIVTVADLYTKEQLNLIFKACHETRDKAMLEVLYESACRASELLSMTFKGLTFNEDDTAIAIVSGKTGTRNTYLKDSVPALKAWLNVHPIGEGAIWVTLRRPHKQLSYKRLFAKVSTIIDEAGLTEDKRKIVHIFRHTRITELVTLGIHGQLLHKLVGWTKGSNMEAVYVHLSTTDVENEVRSKVFGLETDEPVHRPLLESKKCPRCSTINDEHNIVCSKCGLPLSDDAIVQALGKKQKEEERIADLEEKVKQLGEALSWAMGKKE